MGKDKLYNVLDLMYHPEEGQECFQGTMDECQNFLKEQSDFFMYKIVPVNNCEQNQLFENIDWSKVTQKKEVIELIKECERIKHKINILDNKAMVRYFVQVISATK